MPKVTSTRLVQTSNIQQVSKHRSDASARALVQKNIRANQHSPCVNFDMKNSILSRNDGGAGYKIFLIFLSSPIFLARSNFKAFFNPSSLPICSHHFFTFSLQKTFVSFCLAITCNLVDRCTGPPSACFELRTPLN